MKRALLNSKVITALIFLILIGVVWFAGSLMGLRSAEARFGVIFLLMLLWVVTLMVGKFLADRSSLLLERMLRRNADEAVIAASPEQRAEMAQLRKRLLGAITTLKTSNLGKTRGRAALYELPWYMILGHPAAGKSCAIQQSGLKFPLAGKGTVAIQGIGGTRDCDWFFSTEGVLLDTAGRYSTQREDRPEWLEFLKLLKKYRPKAPLNGVLMAVSLPELQKHQGEAFAAYAQQLRQRIHELEDAFGMKVPVYLVFTKLDLLAGFRSFFQDLSPEECQQVWGASLTHEQNTTFDAVATVAAQFDTLSKGLEQSGLDRLAHNRSNLGRPALFAFPIEFNSLRPAVLKLVECLVEEDPYHHRPLIRGFYFTSALQAGEPEHAAAQRLTQSFGLGRATAAADSRTTGRSYFLESLFRKVVFPDRYLVGRGSSRRRSHGRMLSLAAGVLAIAALAGTWTLSFVLNQKLIQEVQQEQALAAKLMDQDPSLGIRLRTLQMLQGRIEQLQHHREEGAPWSMRWGLYRGHDLEKGLRATYYRGLRTLMLSPVKANLEERMRAFLGEIPVDAAPANTEASQEQPHEAAYNTLKSYLMLQQRDVMDASHLANQLPRHWAPWLESQAGSTPIAELRRAAERTVAFYVTQLKEQDLPLIETQSDLVSRMRTRLAGDSQNHSPFERIYGEIKSRGNARFRSLTVGVILDGKDLDLVAGSSTVGGSFTLEGWNGYIKATLQEASEGKFKGTDWVLASALDNDLTRLGTQAENHAKLLALYKADYIKEWERFLTGVAIQPFEGGDKAAEALGRLADLQRSPIRLLFARAAQETIWDNPSQISKTVDSVKNQVLERTARLLGPATPAAPEAGAALGEVGGRFAFLANLTTPVNGRSPLDGYFELLLKVKGRMASLAGGGDPGQAARQLFQATLAGSGSELAEAQTFVDNTLMANAGETGRTLARPLLLRPLTMSCQSLVPLVEQDLNRAWNQQVMGAWSNLAGKYPFSDASNEAAISEIVKFLKPGEGNLPRFVTNTLGSLVVRRGDTLAVRSSSWPEVRISPSVVNSISRLLQAAEALGDGDVCRFELQALPTPKIRETVLELDAQRLEYRNGAERWAQFTWPNGNSQGGRIQVVSNEGASATVSNCNGRMGLMRMLDQARIEPRGGQSLLEWRFRVPQSFSNRASKEPQREETYPHPAKFYFRMVSGFNPLKLSGLRNHSLPSRITS